MAIADSFIESINNAGVSFSKPEHRHDIHYCITRCHMKVFLANISWRNSWVYNS